MPIGWENCDLDGVQTEGGAFHYLDTQPFHEGMSRNGRKGLGWPAQWVELLFIHLILTPPQQFPLMEGLRYLARARPLPQPNHNKKAHPSNISTTHAFSREPNMEARSLGPCLPMNKRTSTTNMNESKFIHCITQAPQLQQPCPAEQIVGRAPKKQASEPPAETNWGKEK